MSIFRINEFQAKAGQGDLLAENLKSYDPIYKTSEGFRSHQVLQSVEDPSRVLVIEVWDSISAHQLAVKKIPVHASEEVMKLLAKSLKGAYYRR